MIRAMRRSAASEASCGMRYKPGIALHPAEKRGYDSEEQYSILICGIVIPSVKECISELRVAECQETSNLNRKTGW